MQVIDLLEIADVSSIAKDHRKRSSLSLSFEVCHYIFNIIEVHLRDIDQSILDPYTLE
jgi:hypothetical protein